MNSSKVVMGDTFLEDLVKASHLSRGGADWLKVAIDPFHDSRADCAGFPDINVSPSVVQCVKQTASISCPGSITTGTWDCHIFSMPWFTQEAMTLWTKNKNLLYTPSPVSALGHINACAVQSGNSTAIIGGSGVFTQPIALSDNYFKGPSRVIAAGIEVVNTTAEIYRQGLVTVYRNPTDNPVNTEGFTIVDASTPTKVTGVVAGPAYGFWPALASDAMLLTGSRQWAAEEGAYLVETLNALSIPVSGEDYSIPVMYSDETSGATVVAALTPTPTLSGVVYTFNPMSVQPFNQSGAFFTGLSLQSTLQVTVNVYVERFPDPTESDLVPLAKPSPGYDARALELYCVALGDLPPGVMVKENGLGDWFGDTIGKIAGYVAPVLKAIPTPMSQAAGFLADGLSGGSRSRSYMSAPSATKFPKTKYEDSDSYEDGYRDGKMACSAKHASQAGGGSQPRAKAPGKKKKKRL